MVFLSAFKDHSLPMNISDAMKNIEVSLTPLQQTEQGAHPGCGWQVGLCRTQNTLPYP